MKDRRICKVPCACRPTVHSVIISFYSDTVTHGVDLLIPYTYMDGQSSINLCMHAIIAFMSFSQFVHSFMHFISFHIISFHAFVQPSNQSFMRLVFLSNLLYLCDVNRLCVSTSSFGLCQLFEHDFSAWITHKFQIRMPVQHLP